VAKLVKCPACGETVEVVIPSCSVCGADLLTVAAEGPDADAHGHELSDRDQTTSDDDQTWSDHDQTASDSDQRTADEDQDASDVDFSAGGDPAAHQRGIVARDRTRSNRAAVSELRDESAAGRTQTAEERDRTALLRDHAGTGGAVTRSEDDESAENWDDILIRAKQDRAQAAADRAKAAEDRARAALDREQAAHERAEAHDEHTKFAANLKQSTHDELTGVWTRKFGVEEIARELERAHRTGTKLTLAFVDVDALKVVNDDKGHLAGDALLRVVGATLLMNLRPYDVVVRYGGDEFICAMPNLTGAQARKRFEIITTLLAAINPHHSITFGLAEAEPADDLRRLVARADAALLEARQ
jgi:diguanylate cyclase (GGDEF)-like protein